MAKPGPDAEDSIKDHDLKVMPDSLQTFPASARALTLDSNLLEETYPDQENQVNVRWKKVTRTALFHPGDGPQRIVFQ